MTIGGDAIMTNKKRLGLSIPKVLYDKLLLKSEYEGKTLNGVCLEIFWNYFKKNQNSKDRIH